MPPVPSCSSVAAAALAAVVLTGCSAPSAAPAAGANALLDGMFSYRADAPRIVLCADGRSLPVAMEGDYLALERAYSATRPAGAPRWVQVEAGVAPRKGMEESLPPQPTLVVARFVRLDPQGRCAAPAGERPLLGTSWRLVWLGGSELAAPGPRSPGFRLQDGRLSGSDGCNRVSGGYTLDGDRLSFGSLMSTRMACIPEAPETPGFTAAMAGVKRYVLRGDVLELLAADGSVLARMRPAP